MVLVILKDSRDIYELAINTCSDEYVLATTFGTFFDDQLVIIIKIG